MSTRLFQTTVVVPVGHSALLFTGAGEGWGAGLRPSDRGASVLFRHQLLLIPIPLGPLYIARTEKS